jgi:DNA mismatch repair protein MLH1
LVRGDYKERTIEEVLVRSSTVSHGHAPFRECELTSVAKLRKQVIHEAHEPLCSLFRKHILVGFRGLSHVLFSSDDTLHVCQLFSLTRLLFYQLFVFRFGNFGRIDFSDPIEIAPLLALLGPNEMNGVLVLMRYKDMLSDFFSIVIESGRLLAMPNVLPGYVPSFTSLPLFLHRLVTEVNWEFEFDCLCELVNELSMLYAMIPEDGRDLAQQERLQKELKTVVMPIMKTDAFLPPATLIHDMTLSRIASVPEMYSIFERT